MSANPTNGRKPQVLLCGAGPTGLFLAYALTRQGVAVRLVDRHAGPATQSRAMGVHARTLEFYRQFGIAEAAVGLGVRTGDAHLWVDGHEALRFSLADMGRGLSPYPFLLTLAQDVHERFLVDRLAALGVHPQWNTEVTAVEEEDGAVMARLRHGDGTVEEVRTPWLVGCDGAHSITRRAIGADFAGGTSEGLFYVADIEVAGGNLDIHAGLDADGFVLMLPVRTTGMQRLIGIVPQAVTDRKSERAVAFEDVGDQAGRLLGLSVKSVNWFSTYKVHHRVAERFRAGRRFIAGDAGHIHSPVGGQGMNTGLGDAMNLAWKLAAVIGGRAGPALLDTYEPERIAFARSLIASTDRAFRRLVDDGILARTLRLRVLPPALGLVSRLGLSRRMLFSAVSQIRIEYRDSPLSQGRAGDVRAGDRLPFVAAIDNHASLEGAAWRLHVYGRLSDDLLAAAWEANLPVDRFEAGEAVRRAGIAEDAAYLLRPDGHVGLALPTQDVAALRAYAARHGLRFARAAAAPATA